MECLFCLPKEASGLGILFFNMLTLTVVGVGLLVSNKVYCRSIERMM